MVVVALLSLCLVLSAVVLVVCIYIYIRSGGV